MYDLKSYIDRNKINAMVTYCVFTCKWDTFVLFYQSSKVHSERNSFTVLIIHNFYPISTSIYYIQAKKELRSQLGTFAKTSSNAFVIVERRDFLRRAVCVHKSKSLRAPQVTMLHTYSETLLSALSDYTCYVPY